MRATRSSSRATRASRTSASRPTGRSSATSCPRPPTSTTTAAARASPSRPRRPRRTPTRPRSGRRWPPAGSTRGTTTACTGWTPVLPTSTAASAFAGDYDPWRVPIVVDGAPAEVQGTLTYEESVSPLPYLGLALIVAVLIGYYGRGRGMRLPAALLAVVSLAATVVGRADFQSTPDGGGNPLLWVLPAVALVTALGAVILARRSAAVVLALASVASPVGLGAVPHPGLAEARAPHRPARTRPTARRSPSPWASASPPPTSPSPAASSPSPT